MTDATTRSRPAKTTPRGGLPEAVAIRWRRRNIDCATCPLFRVHLEQDWVDEIYGKPARVKLYTPGFCDWRPKIAGFPGWANEMVWRAIQKEGNIYSDLPRKGTCSAKPTVSPHEGGQQ